MTQVPDSFNPAQLKDLVSFRSLAANVNLRDVVYSPLDGVTGLFDHFVLCCLTLDGPTQGGPNPIQLLISCAGLVSALAATLRQTADDLEAGTPADKLQSLFDNLPSEEREEAILFMKDRANVAAEELGSISMDLEAIKDRWMAECAVEGVKARGISSLEPETIAFVSDAFLKSINLTRSRLNSITDRPVGL